MLASKTNTGELLSVCNFYTARLAQLDLVSASDGLFEKVHWNALIFNLT